MSETNHNPQSPPLVPIHFDSYSSDSPSARDTSTSYTAPPPVILGQGEEWGKQKTVLAKKDVNKASDGFVFLHEHLAADGGVRNSARSFDWSLEDDPCDSLRRVLRRRLGPTEVSYYLGSRAEGVNDMYLRIGFRAPPQLMTEERIFRTWRTILSRHTLLWSSIRDSGYHDIHFVNHVPQNEAEFDDIVRSHLAIKTATNANDILDEYLNGDRLLGHDRLSLLTIATPEITVSNETEQFQEYDFILFSTHFIGDGIALHKTANEFFELVVSQDTFIACSPVKSQLSDLSRLPAAFESRITPSIPWGRTAWAAAKVAHNQQEAKNLGGQSFYRTTRGLRRTVVPTISYSVDESKQILATCKSHQTTIASVMFALSNLAYVRSNSQSQDRRHDKTLPTNLYSALNVRGLLEEGNETTDPYHLAIGYYNIVLPSFYPSGVPASTYFWHQAASVRAQTYRIVKSRFLKSRTILMAFERERKSIEFERAEERLKRQNGLVGLGIQAQGPVDTTLREMKESAERSEGVRRVKEKKKEEEELKTKVPNVSLLGLSMLGNLDSIYNHPEFSKRGVELHTLTTGSRQRPGAILLFSYTFAGKLWISLGYDSNGFQEGVIELWWLQLLRGIEEMLLVPGSDEKTK